MSCKVIRWFKRQASLRKNPEKNDEKTQSSPNNSDEKKKTGFPRLSFRKRHKKKTESGAFDPQQGTLAIVGISKKFSLSVPKEMEAHTAKESVSNGLPTSTSVGFGGNASLTNSPSKSEGDKTTLSESSYHSSFDCSRDLSGDHDAQTSPHHAQTPPPPPPNEDAASSSLQVIKETKDSSQKSCKGSNGENPQTFHSVSSSINSSTKDEQSISHLSDDSSIGAPIIKMEEICGNVSDDKDHPVETPKHDEEEKETTKDINTLRNDESIEETEKKPKEECADYIKSKKSENENTVDSCEPIMDVGLASDHSNMTKTEINTVEVSDVGLASDHSEMTKMEISTVEISDSPPKEDNVPPDPKDYNVFEEIEKLVSDTIDSIEEKSSENESKTQIGISDNSVTDVSLNKFQINVVSDDEPTTHSNNTHINDRIDNEYESECDKTKINEVECQKSDIETINEKSNNESAIEHHQFVSERDESNHEEDANKNDLNKPSVQLPESQHINIETEKEDLSPDLNQLSLNSLPINNRDKEDAALSSNSKTVPNTNMNYYPKDLNPFGDDEDDSDEDIVENRFNERNINFNSKVTQSIKNDRYNNKENDHHNPFEADTNVNMKTPPLPSHSNNKFAHPGQPTVNDDHSIKTSNKSLNPFGDSDDDDEDFGPINGTHHRDPLETPPQLPPKLGTRQDRRKSDIAPVPYPRTSKKSHHGSYSSLRNIVVAPVPAPRSITPSGSVQTLNNSSNPFGEDYDDDGENTERRGFQKSTLKNGSSPSVPSSFIRSEASGSLPPTLRIRTGKKRPAPLPPISSQNKVQPPANSSCDLETPENLPRPRASTNPTRARSHTPPESESSRIFGKKPPSGRAVSPAPPPRPPPPEMTKELTKKLSQSKLYS